MRPRFLLVVLLLAATTIGCSTMSRTARGTGYTPSQRWQSHREEGLASWYGPKHHGRRTANGERFDTYAYTAAHRRLPMNTCVDVRNLDNGSDVVVRINDRGPYAKGRIIDLSQAAASDIGMIDRGVARVRVEAIGNASSKYCRGGPSFRSRILATFARIRGWLGVP